MLLLVFLDNTLFLVGLVVDVSFVDSEGSGGLFAFSCTSSLNCCLAPGLILP